MSSLLDDVARRRTALVARSDQNRDALIATVGGLENQFAIAEMVVATARRLHWNRGLVGAVALGLLVAPAAARQWVRRALWLAPLVLEGFRMARNTGEARHRDTPPE